MRFMTLWRPGKNANPPAEADGENGPAHRGDDQVRRADQTGGWDPKGPCTTLRSSGGKVTMPFGVNDAFA